MSRTFTSHELAKELLNHPNMKCFLDVGGGPVEPNFVAILSDVKNGEQAILVGSRVPNPSNEAG